MAIDLISILGEDYDGPVEILDSFMKADSLINNPKYERIMCSVSAGADSDCMLDLLWRVDVDKKIKYVFYDTGLECQASKDHLNYLRDRYSIEIMEYKAKKPIPWTCKNVGVPVISKYASEMISRLQRHNFQWEDEPYETLSKKYENCTQALKWFSNCACSLKGKFNINEYKGLRDYLISNPPDFPVSQQCCKYAKKDVSKACIKELKIQLNCYGVRRSESTLRASTYKTCFTEGKGCDDYRPIVFWTDDVRRDYEKRFNIVHSDCYTVWGLRKTGCAACSFGRNYQQELEVIKEHEPKLYQACLNIFGKAYEWTEGYKRFKEEMDKK
jgi:3'-phosphoadenosine 5'-phosphosulfate sulfotransferase (PAPS reductase)/FAD synthetase